jgi:hypothetical protein
MRRTPLALPGASAAGLRPRAWLAFQALDAELAAWPPSGPLCWALVLVNSGPELRAVELEIAGPAPGLAAERHDLGGLGPGATGWVFLGGPSRQPPRGRFRLWARGSGGAPVFGEAVFHGFEVAPEPAGALLPIGYAAWPPGEYLPRAERCAQLAGPAGERGAEAEAEAAALSAALDGLLARQAAPLSEAAARELAWSALRAVFGCAEADLQRGDVARLVQRLGQALREPARRPSGSAPPDAACSLAA